MTSHININKRCPICGNTILGYECLILKYHAPLNWWVLYHLKDCYKPIEDTNIRCGEAKYQIEHII